MDNPTIWTINGIHDSRAGTTALLAEKLKECGLPVGEIVYDPISAREANKRAKVVQVGKIIKNHAKNGDWIIGHSAAGNFIHEACRKNQFNYVKFDTIILFAPAMDMTVDWHNNAFNHHYTICNPYDLANTWGALIPNHVFGRAGKYGFEYELSESYRMNTLTDADLAGKWNHSNWFRKKLWKWYPQINHMYREQHIVNDDGA